MFTGIVEEKGSVRYMQLTGESGVLAVKAKKVLERTKIGDSIAVNGVCLTVTSLQPDGFTADVMAETIRRSSLGSCKVGSQVNLERAMAADGRFGGHIVSGHIDGTGVIRSLIREENAIWVSIGTSPQILHLIVEKSTKSATEENLPSLRCLHGFLFLSEKSCHFSSSAFPGQNVFSEPLRKYSPYFFRNIPQIHAQIPPLSYAAPET